MWWKGWKCPGGSDAQKIFTIKDPSDIFNNTESTKDKMLKADPNAEIWQFAKKDERCSLGAISFTIIRRKVMFKLFLVSIYKEMKHFSSQYF